MISFESTGLPEILADLAAMPMKLRLDGDLGAGILDVFAAGILESSANQRDPDGHLWPELSPEYEIAKADIAPGAPISHLYGHMMTTDQVEGERYFNPRVARMTYGLDGRAREEATWFQEGDSNQPPRPFYGISKEAAKKADALVDAKFSR